MKTDFKGYNLTSDLQIDYRKNLNPQQYKVVTQAEGPCLVLAGAGSGKTRVLVYRLAYLVEKGTLPENVMLVTFTNKAAREMISRAEALLKRSLSKLWMGTFHHIGATILRREAHRAGFSPNFTIIDREDSKDLIQDCIEELGFQKQRKLFPKKDLILNVYSTSLNSQRDLEKVIIDKYSHIEEYASQIKRVISKYIQKKKEANILDFEDLLVYWLKLLENENLARRYSQLFQYILVDEYQDTNRLQFEILKKLASTHRNILVVGDDAQSIYSFRSAEIRNILDFPSVFKDAKIFKLQINYRSTPQILKLANNIINNNKNQFPKNLKAINKSGELPHLVTTKDVYQQAEFTAKKILEFYHQGIPLKEIAILFRSRYLALELEMELIKRNLPYIVRGGLRFFEQAHIKDILSYLKILINPYDELSFKRALCLYPGVGRSYAQKIWKFLVKEKKDKEFILKNIPKTARQGFKDFFKIFSKIKKEPSPQKILRLLTEEYKNYCYSSFENPEDRLLDLEELTKIAQKFSDIKNFLEEVASYEEFKGETLVSNPQEEDILILSTIHQAKGLEWCVVFLIGCNEYDFPHPKALDSQERLEEERRLFYVAVTRAKKYVYITYPESRYTFRNGLVICRPSLFIYEIPKNLYQEESYP
ncbi:MAG: ATP-dependent helicase [Candidatus Omnitrophica bacterium]|nr:ATP-dependent helicase [Candidatus Omnitrophota bacterium]